MHIAELFSKADEATADSEAWPASETDVWINAAAENNEATSGAGDSPLHVTFDPSLDSEQDHNDNSH